ncbi:MAG TPA: hypothetical protein VIJ34_09265 [Acidimicrobiales bacterium]
MPQEHWQTEPQQHDFPAAVNYLSLLMPQLAATTLVNTLRSAPTVRHQAKDLLRASRLNLLKKTNAHVASDLAKIRSGEMLSPVLLVRGNIRHGFALTIADGYHRVCASYWIDENAEIPCRVVDLASGASPSEATTES